MAYSVTKAGGLQLMKNLALTQGPKIRVNAILPGLMLTEWVRYFIFSSLSCCFLLFASIEWLFLDIAHPFDDRASVSDQK